MDYFSFPSRGVTSPPKPSEIRITGSRRALAHAPKFPWRVSNRALVVFPLSGVGSISGDPQNMPRGRADLLSYEKKMGKGNV